MNIVKTTVHNRYINVPAPSHIPDGAEVTLTIAESGDNEAMSPEEISSILGAMQQLEQWEIPKEVADDLDAWVRKINQHGIEHHDPSMEDVFP